MTVFILRKLLLLMLLLLHKSNCLIWPAPKAPHDSRTKLVDDSLKKAAAAAAAAVENLLLNALSIHWRLVRTQKFVKKDNRKKRPANHKQIHRDPLSD